VSLISEELPQPDSTLTIQTDKTYAADAGPGENWRIAVSYREYLVQSSQMTEENRMKFHPYRLIWVIAPGGMAELARRSGLNSKAISILYNQWLFDSPRGAQFVLDEGAKELANFMWCIAHPDERLTGFADLALHVVSCGVSEADAEGVLSMHKTIAGLHGTRFGIRTMEVRLRYAIALPTRRPDQEVVAFACADWPAWIEEDGSDEPAEAMDPDNDLELDDDDFDAERAREPRYKPLKMHRIRNP
jgi:hypothetical protein